MKARKFVMFPLLVIGFLAILYLAACALLYSMQDSFVFHPLPNDAALAKEMQPPRVEIKRGESIIEGWWSENPNSKTSATVLYFGGNGEDVLYFAQAAKQIDARRVLVTNYRGYGSVPGEPSQKALFEDALVVYDYAMKQPDVAANNIVVMGRSLGSGVATYIAANRPVKGVILITPYDSIVSVAQEKFSWIPVGWLLRNKFPSDEFAHHITAPVILVAGSNDELIPPAHAQRLYEAWSGPKEIQILQGAGHNSIDQKPEYYPLINAFLAR